MSFLAFFSKDRECSNRGCGRAKPVQQSAFSRRNRARLLHGHGFVLPLVERADKPLLDPLQPPVDLLQLVTEVGAHLRNKRRDVFAVDQIRLIWYGSL